MINYSDKLRLQLDFIKYYKSSQWSYQGIKQSSTIFYLILDGQGTIDFCGQEFDLNPGNMYVLPAGLEMNLNTAMYIEKVWGSFRFIIPPGFDLVHKLEKVYEIKKVFDPKVLKDCEYKAAHARSCLWQFIPHIQDLLCEYDLSIPSPRDQKLMNYINKNLDAQLRVQDIARHVGMSHEALSRDFKKKYKLNLKQYINQRLNQEICTFIKNENRKYHHIAKEFNFVDEAYFYQFFKRMNKCTPTEYLAYSPY
ncbi:helix-turn-helix domain-containing protein [Lentisphaera profundi]|uniref:Helix-turn-helix domain-containing protein n=1 Tax=Lentisphaera profundi TaxID=1658616 RepID=A0ABY7VNK8_9BACT|nr:helix-turn-helix domain-containing protein [Lentisphaera profundi]WDE95242.1 helix-turn-helix domain-containing protein [Lentisphaera profundi]